MSQSLLGAFFCLAVASPATAQFDTPLIPASGGYSDGIEDVDISGDIAVVATRGSADSVYVFRRSGSGWFPDTAFVLPGGQLNRSIAVEGNRLVVGDTRVDLFGENAGAVFVFDYLGDYPDGAWTHTATFAGDDTEDFDAFGEAVELTDSLAVIGAGLGHPSAFDGAIYVFRLQADGSYAQEAKLFPELAFFDGGFGEDLAVSVTPKGERILAGQPTAKPGFPEAAYFYARTGPPGYPNGGWVLEDTSAAPPSQPDTGYGGLIALDGDRALVSSGLGIQVFRHEGGAWFREALLTPEAAHSVALIGTLAIFGVETWDEAGENAGALLLFERENSGDWPLRNVLTATNAEAGDLLGREASVDGSRIVIGGRRKVWVFDLSTLVALEPDAPSEEISLSIYPNPARDRATLLFSVPEAGRVHVALHDLLGRQVAVIEDAVQVQGRYQVGIATDGLPAGVYAARISMTGDAHTILLSVVP